MVLSTYFLFFWLSLKLVILLYFSLMNIRLVNKKRVEGGPRDDAANETTSDPRDLKLQQLDRDFELALKSGKTSTRRRRKEEEEDIVPFVSFSPMSISFFFEEDQETNLMLYFRTGQLSRITSWTRVQPGLWPRCATQLLLILMPSWRRSRHLPKSGCWRVLRNSWTSTSWGKIYYEMFLTFHSQASETHIVCAKHTYRSHVHNTFLDNGILEAMKLWLEPLQDASLPSLDIIQDFLDILDIVSFLFVAGVFFRPHQEQPSLIYKLFWYLSPPFIAANSNGSSCQQWSWTCGVLLHKGWWFQSYPKHQASGPCPRWYVQEQPMLLDGCRKQVLGDLYDINDPHNR